jgi:hypothetical protein
VYEVLGPQTDSAWPASDFAAQAEQVRTALARLKESDAALENLPLWHGWAHQKLWQRAGETLGSAWGVAADADRVREYLASLAELRPIDNPEGRKIEADRRALDACLQLEEAGADVSQTATNLESVWSEMSAEHVNRLANALANRVAGLDDLDAIGPVRAALATAREVRPAAADEIEPAVLRLGVRELRLRLAQPTAPDWIALGREAAELDAACARRNVVADRWMLKAARAECAMEGADPAKAEQAAAAARTLLGEIGSEQAASQSYDDYVAIVLDAMSRPSGARARDAARDRAGRLLAAWAAASANAAGEDWTAWQTPARRKRSADLLLDAAESVTGLADAATRGGPRDPFAAAGDQNRAALAEETYGWLQAALAMSDADVDRDLRLNLAAAACYKSPPDYALAAEQVGLYAPSQVEIQPRLIEALALREGEPSRALATFANLVDELRDRKQPRGEVFRWVLKPALELAETQSPGSVEPELSATLARLYAALGRFVQEDVDPGQFALAGGAASSAEETAFLAFDKAVAFAPQSIDYHVDRGLAHLEWKGAQTDFDALYDDDIKFWKEDAAARPTPGAYSLLARMKIWQSRRPERSIKEKAELLAEATDFCRLATENDQTADNALQLVWYSTALVELVNYTSDERVMREHLELACQKADAAKAYAFAPHPERPFLAKGNALEDFGWVLQDHSRWPEAIGEFTEAERSARGNDDEPARDKALLNRGRARYKYAASGKDPQSAEDLELAIADLAEAAESGGLTPKYQAEAHYWQTNSYLAQKNFPAAEASQAKGVEIIGPAGDSWVTHQLKWASVPVSHARHLLAEGGSSATQVEELYAAARVRYGAVFTGRERSIRPDHRAEAFGNLAQIRLAQNQPEQALQDYARVLAESKFENPTTRIDLLLQMSLYITDQRTGVFAKGDNGAKSIAAADEALKLLARDPALDLDAVEPPPAADPVRVAEGYAARAYALQETYFGNKKPADLVNSLRSFKAAVRFNPRLRASREWRKDVSAMSIACSRVEKEAVKKVEFLESAKEFVLDPVTKQPLEGLQDAAKKLADERKKHP